MRWRRLGATLDAHASQTAGPVEVSTSGRQSMPTPSAPSAGDQPAGDFELDDMLAGAKPTLRWGGRRLKQPEFEAGRVVILNGTSSAGKSTIAKLFCEARAALGDLWLPVAIDDFNAKLPEQWFSGGDFKGQFSQDGVRFEPAGGGLQVRVGELGRRFYGAYHRTVGAIARAGFNVIVDEVAFDEATIVDWSAALRGLPVAWVAVRCDPAVAQARELERGDRLPGLALGLSAVVHMHASYDLELDTTELSPDEACTRLTEMVTARSPRTSPEPR